MSHQGDGGRVGFYLLPRHQERAESPPSPRLRPRLSIIQELSEESSAASTPRAAMGRGEEGLEYARRIRELEKEESLERGYARVRWKEDGGGRKEQGREEPKKHHCDLSAHPRTSLAHQSSFESNLTCPIPDPSFRSSSPGPGDIHDLRLHGGILVGGGRGAEGLSQAPTSR